MITQADLAKHAANMLYAMMQANPLGTNLVLTDLARITCEMRDRQFAYVRIFSASEIDQADPPLDVLAIAETMAATLASIHQRELLRVKKV